jgi:hypothetical protein
MRWKSKTLRAYQRELPGGGFVAIDITTAVTMLRGRCWYGRIVVERRSEPSRRTGNAPVIGHAADKTMELVMQQLLPTALCNQSIGAAILRLRSRAA